MQSDNRSCTADASKYEYGIAAYEQCKNNHFRGHRDVKAKPRASSFGISQSRGVSALVNLLRGVILKYFAATFDCRNLGESRWKFNMLEIHCGSVTQYGAH